MKNRPWCWVPSAYFSQALPYAMVITVSSIFYKNLALSNAWIAFMTSWFFLPWLLKPIWAAWLEKIHARYKALIFCQVISALIFAALALVLLFHALPILILSLIGFIGIAFLSASFDMLSDGLYINALPHITQQMFVGIRTFFYQLARVVCVGALVVLVGHLAVHFSYQLAWAIGFGLVALLQIILAVWHVGQLPRIAPNRHTVVSKLKAVTAFFQQPGIGAILLFLLLYNFGEAQMQRVVPLFLMSQGEGGLGLGNQSVGLIFGFYGIISLSIGALVSGGCIVRWGLKRCLWWMTLLMVFSNSGYVLLADSAGYKMPLIIAVVIFAQASFGLANSAYMCVLLQAAKDRRYTLTWYALASSFMALGMMLPGMLSGMWLAHFVFLNVFIVILALSLISFVVTACFLRIQYESA